MSVSMSIDLDYEWFQSHTWISQTFSCTEEQFKMKDNSKYRRIDMSPLGFFPLGWHPRSVLTCWVEIANLLT